MNKTRTPKQQLSRLLASLTLLTKIKKSIYTRKDKLSQYSKTVSTTYYNIYGENASPEVIRKLAKIVSIEAEIIRLRDSQHKIANQVIDIIRYTK